MWLNISEEFKNRSNFPNCLCAVGGKHFFSIGLMAVADANYKLIYVDVGSYGKDSDSTIFRNSVLWKNLERNNLNIPLSPQVPGINIPILLLLVIKLLV